MRAWTAGEGGAAGCCVEGRVGVVIRTLRAPQSHTAALAGGLSGTRSRLACDGRCAESLSRCVASLRRWDVRRDPGRQPRSRV